MLLAVHQGVQSGKAGPCGFPQLCFFSVSQVCSARAWGLRTAGAEQQAEGSVLGLRRATTFREMWGGSTASFSKRTPGSTLCWAWVRTWGHEGEEEMEMTIKGIPDALAGETGGAGTTEGATESPPEPALSMPQKEAGLFSPCSKQNTHSKERAWLGERTTGLERLARPCKGSTQCSGH